MIERPLGHEVHVLSNLIGRAIESSPARMKIEDATGNNTWIIAFIARRAGTDVFQRDLEQHFGITRSTASKVVSLMVSKGLLERQSIPGDARLKKLVLTDRSWEILNCMDAEFQAIEDALVEGFSPQEVAQIYNYLERMQENAKHMKCLKEPEPGSSKQKEVSLDNTKE